MTKANKTRWGMCERCLDQLGISKGFIDKFKAYVQNNRHKKWKNPFFNVMAKEFLHRNENIKKLCSNCRFVMEHTILSQELSND